MKKKQGGSAAVSITALGLAAVFSFQFLSIKTGVLDAMSTDDAMRLVEVRDLLNGQSWFDLWQHRLDPPGVLMHWSRLVDLPLALSILVLKPFIGTHSAESITLLVWPLLLFAASLALVVGIARTMSGGVVTSQIAAVVLTLLAKPALVHFQPGAIDHHNVQIVLLLALVLCALWIERSARAALLAGLAASLSLAIGVEMLPAIAALSVAIVGLFIWRGAPVARHVATFGTALAASALLLAMVLIPHAGLLSPVCDSFGGPILLLTVGGGLSVPLMAAVDSYYPAFWLRLSMATGAAIGLIAVFMSQFGECLASPYAQLDPLVASLWLDRVQETISLAAMLRLGPEEVLGFYAFPLLTLGIAIAASIRTKMADRFQWAVGIVALVVLFGISIWEMRGTGGATMVAAPIFAAAAVVVWPSLAVGRNLALVALVVSPAAFMASGLLAKPLTDAIFKPVMTASAPDTSKCQSMSDVASLRQLPKGRVMAPIDLGPAILAETDHDIFAAPYHRNNDGNLALLSLMLATPPVAHQILSNRKVDYVVVCRTNPNHTIIERAPDGLEAELARGETPEFLQPIDLGASGKISVWRARH